jgi:AcrR family transcriptional regulator
MPKLKSKALKSKTPKSKTPKKGHARGKDRRRALLISAARDLIAERADGKFSMQELAARAGLSLATPYNLLGSKANIVQAVFRAETEGFRLASKSEHRRQPVERMMAIADHTVAVFAHQPQFYRNLSRILGALDPEEMRQLIVPFADTMLQPMVEELFAEGAITVAVSPVIITSHLQRVFESTFLHWVALDWDRQFFRRELRAGFALTFLGLFNGKNREALLAYLGGRSRPSKST